MATARSSLAFPGRTAHHGAMSEPTTPTIDPIPEGLAERAALLGGTEGILTDEQIREFVAGQLASTEVDGKSVRSEEHTSELQSRGHLVCRLLLEKKENSSSQSTSA